MAWYNQMAKVRKQFFDWFQFAEILDLQRVDLQNFKFQAGQPSHLPDEGAGFKVQRKREETRCGIASWNGGSFSGRQWSTGFFPWVSSKSETFFVSLGPECCGLFFSGLYQGLELGKQGWMVFNSWLHSPNQLQAGLKLKACFLGSGWSLSWCQGRIFVWLNLFSSPIGWRERDWKAVMYQERFPATTVNLSRI